MCVPRPCARPALSPISSPRLPSPPLRGQQQLRAGLPPGLRFIGLFQFQVEDVAEVVRVGFPMVRLARVEDAYYTVIQQPGAAGAVTVEEWPKSRTRYNVTEWLEWYDCAGAEWRDPAEFL